MAYQTLAHPEGELASVRAATALQAGMVASTLSSHTLEAIAHEAQHARSALQRRARGGVEHGQLGTALEQQPRGSLAAPAEPEHRRMFSRVVHVVHRSFKVASPRRAKMIERIQKRTMTRGSGQPFFS